MRERSGRLVQRWRNIISLSSRRGFVIHRLPSASAALLPSLSPNTMLPCTVQSSTEVCVCECVQTRARSLLHRDGDSARSGPVASAPCCCFLESPDVALQRTVAACGQRRVACEIRSLCSSVKRFFPCLDRTGLFELL